MVARDPPYRARARSRRVKVLFSFLGFFFAVFFLLERERKVAKTAPKSQQEFFYGPAGNLTLAALH